MAFTGVTNVDGPSPQPTAHKSPSCSLTMGEVTSGKSYKGSTIVNYDSRGVIWGIFKSGTTLES